MILVGSLFSCVVFSQPLFACLFPFVFGITWVCYCPSFTFLDKIRKSWIFSMEAIRWSTAPKVCFHYVDALYLYQGQKKGGGVVVVIVWKFDLELHVQSVLITEFESRSWLGVRDTTLCDKVCQWLAIVRWFSPDTPSSSATI